MVENFAASVTTTSATDLTLFADSSCNIVYYIVYTTFLLLISIIISSSIFTYKYTYLIHTVYMFYAATLWKDYCSYCNFKDFSIHSIRADLAEKNLRHLSMNSYSAHHTTTHTIFFSSTAYFDLTYIFMNFTLLHANNNILLFR